MSAQTVEADIDALDDGWPSSGELPPTGLTEGSVVDGRFRIEQIVGVGGTSTVLRARHLRLDVPVVIKVLLPELLEHEEAIERFVREGKAAVRIRSEHVARVFDTGTLQNGAPYIVMEFLEGDDLASWLTRHGPLSHEEAAGYLLQACEALSEAHALGIVHRDLKPSNLFCVRRADGQPVIKVLDFGISKVDARETLDPRVTGTAAVFGSPVYMSPEQMRASKDVGVPTDIWALGITAYELLTGRTPFEATTLAQIAVNAATQKPAPIRAARPEVPASLEDVVFRCLGKDPGDRYQSAAELARALAPFAPRQPFHPLPPAPPSSPRRRVIAGTASLAGVALLVALAGAWLRAQHPPVTAAATMAEGPENDTAAMPALDTDLLATRGLRRIVSEAAAAAVSSEAPPASPQPASSARSHRAVPVRPSPSPVPVPVCEPNFVSDAQGRKHFKPECFDHP